MDQASVLLHIHMGATFYVLSVDLVPIFFLSRYLPPIVIRILVMYIFMKKIILKIFNAILPI